jgi:hypothetical protein
VGYWGDVGFGFVLIAHVLYPMDIAFTNAIRLLQNIIGN